MRKKPRFRMSKKYPSKERNKLVIGFDVFFLVGLSYCSSVLTIEMSVRIEPLHDDVL